jgi:tRNA-binding protein
MNETPQAYIDRILSFVADREPFEVLASTARHLRALIVGRTRDELSRRPDPSRWSTVQILAHLADAEVVASWRLRSIIATDGVPLQPFDQNTWASTFKYADADPFESLQEFDVLRRSNLSLLRRVDQALLANHGMHAERGQETVTHLVRLYAGHDLNHLAQVRRLIDELPPPAFRPAPVRPSVELKDAPLDIRVGTITSAQPVKGSRKLAALRVSFGDHDRTILAGILQERPALDSLIGRQALFVVNLPPKQMAGVTSEGMLFDVGYADGVQPALAIPEYPVPDGTRAG